MQLLRQSFDDRHLALWRDRICDELLDAEAPWDAGRRLDMDLAVAAAGGIVHLDIASRAPGLALARNAQRINRETRRDAIGITYVVSGEAEIASPTRRHRVRAGQLCLLTSEEPFEKTLSAGYAELFLYVPGRGVSAQTALVAEARGLGAVLRDAIVALSRSAAELTPRDWDATLRAMLALANGVFAQTAPAHDVARELRRAAVVRFITEHLDEPDLAPQAIAHALGISVRYLHALFTGGDSVCATILNLRLDRCRTAIATEPARSISEIAYAHGFNDAAHFSRTFKARFGISPRDVRR